MYGVKIYKITVMKIGAYFFIAIELTFLLGVCLAEEVVFPAKGSVVLLADPGNKLSLFSFVPLSQEFSEIQSFENGIASLEQLGLSTCPQIALTLDRDASLIVEAEFNRIIKKSANSQPKSGGVRFRELIIALCNLSQPVRLYPCLTLGPPKAIRKDGSSCLMSQIPVGNLNLRIAKYITEESWKKFTGECQKSLHQSLGIKEKVEGLDASQFWLKEFPRLVSNDGYKISVAWYEPRLGVVCFSWEKGTRGNTTSSDLAAGFTSLLAPASGVIGITDFTDELSNPPPDRKNK
jgi:hypothetical protein